MKPTIFVASLFSIFAMTSFVHAEDDAIHRGLKSIQTAGEKWIEQRGCVSCHQVPSMIWAHDRALAAGVEVSQAKIDQWKSWSTEVVNFVKPQQKPDCDRAATMQGNIDTMAALLLAIPKGASQPWRKEFVDSLVSHQNEDGSWNPCGQLPMQRRPEPETRAATTLWTTLALLQEEVEFKQDLAILFADSIETPVSTEWYAVRLLVAHKLACDSVQPLTKRLLALQNEDGGWGWITGEPSDAFGTGLAMLALAEVEPASAQILKARDYLLRTQTPSGGWLVPGTKASAKGKPTPTANDWGTAFAVLALLSVR